MTLQHFTIADLQRALHEGELSAREIARQTLDDIARVNPQINAGPRSPPSACWRRPTASTPCAGKAPAAAGRDSLRGEKSV